MMIKSVIYELKRAFSSLGTKISILIGSIIVLSDLLTFCRQYGIIEEKRLIQAWIGTDFQFAYNSLFYVLLPVLACLPFAGSYYQDIATGYEKNIIIRASRKHYIVAKCFAVYVSAFICTVTPLLGNLFLAAGLYPNRIPEKLEFLSAGIIDCHRFAVLFNQWPLAYCIVFIFVDGMFAGALGMLAIAVTKYCKSRFSAVITPFVIYVLTGVILVSENGHSMAVMEMLNPVQRYISTTGQMCVMYFSMMLISIVMIWFQNRRRDII